MAGKYFTITLFFVLFLFARKVNGQVAIIPKPNEIKYNEGVFNYAKGLDIKIIRGDDATKFIQKQLADFIKEKNIPLVAFSPTAVSLNLLQTKATDIPSDAYTLTISSGSISIASSGNAGLFYGVQSLMQLLKKDSVKTLPCLEIKDMPAFSYRGMHLDEVHRFFGTELIKQYIDAMAKLKLNQFHWQLADEIKWRITMKADSTLADKEQFYTTTQIKEIVKYAQDRFINITPEIDLPSATENTSIERNKAVIDEVCALFPGPYVHIGNGMTDTSSLQYLLSKNKKIIGQDYAPHKEEILMSYKSNKSGWGAAAKGKDVIMMPRQFCSLDYYQDWDDEKKSFSMSYLPLDKAYALNLYGKIKDSKIQKHILGGQAYVSTQFIKDAEELQYLVFPRLLAIAECVWTKNGLKKFSDFERRLKTQKNYFFKEKDLPKIDIVHIKPR
ncbi:MAG: family 20 glycosylhydrolase [Chitinophagales bacterium]